MSMLLTPREAESDCVVSHAGILVPWANSVVEAELPRWAGETVTWHYARLMPTNHGTTLDAAFMAGLAGAVPGALHQLSKLPLQRIYLACTSVGFSLPDIVRSATSESPVEILTAFDTIVSWLRRAKVHRIVLATPYPAWVTDREVKALEALELDVIAEGSLGLADGYASVSPKQVMALLASMPAGRLADADAVVLSCTGWPTHAVLELLERKMSCPVISSNRSIVAHAFTADRDTTSV